ncbi:hypothetical protein ANN_22636 [Periplaneta americana]|uniref:PiggyBac transposable element-derived protein domain-containing protein n=1 Tax=Periplaneta americana TaxID=6978 RepID=A0ABQ8S8U3_PERAM|nr:hypothetical protein ANN_22636 [Periplaneta americana]
MPSKLDKYGMKVWWACDSKTFYPLNGLPYTGKENCIRVHSGIGRRVVETLSYQGTNRNVTCDNYFTDKELAENLLSNGLILVGTVHKKICIFISPEFQPNKRRPEYSSIFGLTKYVTLVSMHQNQIRQSFFLQCTTHKPFRKKKRNHKLFFTVIAQKKILTHSIISECICVQKTYKSLAICIFMNILDVCGITTFVVWMSLHPLWNLVKQNNRRLFLVAVAESLIQPQTERRPRVGLQKKL